MALQAQQSAECIIAEDDIAALGTLLRQSCGLAAKRDIAHVTQSLGLQSRAIPVGDDCAAMRDGDGYSLLAIEGFMNEFVASDPWFAGWCGVMVNLSDIAAMGGRAVAIVDALWAGDQDAANPVLEGMAAAAKAYGVPIVGGHTNYKTPQRQLSVAVFGKAKALLTSFDARPGDHLILAVDLRGRYREPFHNFEAATDAPPERLQGDFALLPQIVEAGFSRAAKDISQAGIVGTIAMLAECSQVGATIHIPAIPKPADVSMARWLQTFPSFGFVLAVPDEHCQTVIALFIERTIAAADIGVVTQQPVVRICNSTQSDIIYDFSKQSLMGFGKAAETAP